MSSVNEPTQIQRQPGGPMKYHLLTAAILLAALGLYALGMTSGGLVAFLMGAALELWFWVRVIKRSRLAGRPLPSAER